MKKSELVTFSVSTAIGVLGLMLPEENRDTFARFLDFEIRLWWIFLGLGSILAARVIFRRFLYGKTNEFKNFMDENEILTEKKETSVKSSNRLFHPPTPHSSIDYRGEVADVIGIGAINYDFMFKLKRSDGTNRKQPGPGPGSGQEGLNYSLEDVMNRILNFKRIENLEYSSRLGGAAFNALKAIYERRPCDKFPKLAYVGTTGVMSKELLNEFDRDVDFNRRIEKESRIFDIQDWIFHTDEISGLGCFELDEGYRIGRVGEGANKHLISEIEKKLTTLGVEKNAFIKFLSKAKWIHISSLCDFTQFEKFVDAIEHAKILNPLLKVSFDPGSDYMRKRLSHLGKIFYLSDYVFLSKAEYGDFSFDDIEVVKGAFNKHGKSNANIIVQTTPHRARWIKLIDGTGEERELDLVERVETDDEFNVVNDTGYGGAFAGEFIYNELSSRGAKDTEHSIRVAIDATLERLQRTF